MTADAVQPKGGPAHSVGSLAGKAVERGGKSAPRHRQSEYHRMACPHCVWPAVIRTSQAMSALTRQLVYACTNVECGHTFVANTEIVYTLSPSATPDPAVHLPLSRHVRRELLAAELESAPRADYDAQNGRPYTPGLFEERQAPPAAG